MNKKHQLIDIKYYGSHNVKTRLKRVKFFKPLTYKGIFNILIYWDLNGIMKKSGYQEFRDIKDRVIKVQL